MSIPGTKCYVPQWLATNILQIGELNTVRAQHRVHEPLVDICLVSLAMYRATEAAQGVLRHWDRSDWASLGSSVFPHVSIGIPAEGMLEAVTRGTVLDYAKLGVIIDLVPNIYAPKVTAFTRFYNRFISAYFVYYFDPWAEWIRSNISTDVKGWPPTANFCRVVRNAASHGGTVNISSPTATTVSWEHLTYDHRNAGRQIFGTDISGADLIFLMFEMDEELTNLGAPFSSS